LKNRKKLVFDGLRPFLHKLCVLPERNSLLHVFRPQENNDLYFYEEFEDGSYRKAGHLVNHNDPFYAFFPENLWLMENGDVFVHLSVRLDSIWGPAGSNNFNLGGWQSVIRMDGNALGITVSTKDIGSTKNNYKVYPNPASTEIRIASEIAIFPLSGHIYNKLGQKLQSFVLESQEQTIDITNLPSDIYYIQMLDKPQSPIINTLKWVKVE